MPEMMGVLCLAMLAVSIFYLLYFYVINFYDGIRNYVVVLLATLSCGCWYYFYGKIFYDFPFSTYTYSIGYITGNYNLLISPKETIDGIKAYKASHPLFTRLYLAWISVWSIFDHLYDLYSE